MRIQKASTQRCKGVYGKDKRGTGSIPFIPFIPFIPVFKRIQKEQG